jgi:hypothetical protein
VKNEAKISSIADWLEKQSGDHSIRNERICEDLRISQATFYRLKPKADALVAQRLQERSSAIQQGKVQEELEAGKAALKSRTQRLLALQDQVTKIEAKLAEGHDVQYVVIQGQATKITTEMSAQTMGYLHRTLLGIQAEICKLEGDYSPEKRKVTHIFDGPIPLAPASQEIDYEKATLEELDKYQEMIDAAKGSKAATQ